MPTMGALHEGHLALVRQAKRENDSVVVSIFVNPTQFGPSEDFKKYPRKLQKDLRMLRKEAVDLVYTPSVQEMYPREQRTWVEVGKLGNILCGRFRAGHFRGVATVVAKLFSQVQPDRAYFGQKDFQQLKVIERMVHDLDVPVQVRACPTTRDKNGLALSSRNAYLSEAQKKRALGLNQTLRFLEQEIKRGEKRVQILEHLGKIKLRKCVDQVQYLEIRRFKDLSRMNKISNYEKCILLAAVKIGRVRLIDNRIV